MTRRGRRQGRAAALQALYAWQLQGGDPRAQLRAPEGFAAEESAFSEELLRGVVGHAAELEALIAPHLDRDFKRLSPVERAILYIGARELQASPETPFKVVINEAVELGKSYGGTGGHKFVNGVLEKLAAQLRPDEVARAAKTA